MTEHLLPERVATLEERSVQQAKKLSDLVDELRGQRKLLWALVVTTLIGPLVAQALLHLVGM